MLIISSIKKMFMAICLVLFVFIGSSVSDVEAADVSGSSKLLQIENVKFTNDEIVLVNSLKVKGLNNVTLDYDFYEFKTFNGETFVADVIGNQQNLINLSLDSNPNGYVLNVAFYDKETEEYTYYFGEVDAKTIKKITDSSLASSVLDKEYAFVLLSSTRWYMAAIHSDSEIVSNSDISLSKNESNQLLDNYHDSVNTGDSLIQSSLYIKDANSQEIKAPEYVTIMSSASNDDPVTLIIPRGYFTYVGKKTGSVGSIGFYVDTIEFPQNSGRYLSDVITWSNSVFTPSFSSDTARQITKPEFSGLYEYSLNGYPPTYTPIDQVEEVYSNSSLALRSLYSKITINVTNSYGNSTVQYDEDEFIYHMDAAHNGYRYDPAGISVSGVASVLIGIAGVVVTATPWPDDPLFWALASGSVSFGFTAYDGNISTNNGIMSSVENYNNYYSANFVADRSAHFIINGEKYVRRVSAQTDENVYFAPPTHYDFNNLNTTYTFSAYLEREGTNSNDQKVVDFYSIVKIVELDFYWWFGEQRDETYKASKSMTQEATYYRYYYPY